MVDKLNNKKSLFCLGLFGMMIQAQAEVLVILPESGPMARAGNSIKLGIVSAQQSSTSKIPLKFVNSDQKRISDILKQNINSKTQMIIGPLARTDVESLIQQKPKIPVLALNEVSMSHANVWQYSLSKDADADAMIAVLEHDKIQNIYIMRQKGMEADTLSFVNALYKKYQGHVAIVDQVPQIQAKDGILLLGDNTWINSLTRLPKRNIYAQAISIEDNKAMPIGLTFCDVPAVYQTKWSDVVNTYKQNPTTLPFQRLYAFGGDAWQIAEQFVLNPNLDKLKFSGRTGQIQITDDKVARVPACYKNTAKGLVEQASFSHKILSQLNMSHLIQN